MPVWSAQTTNDESNNPVVRLEVGGATNTVAVPARLWKNFTVLMSDLAPALISAAARLAVYTALAAIAGLLTGVMLGFVLWYWLRQRGLFDAPFSWYPYFKWMWALLFPACGALGLAYTFAWLQAGHVAKGAILEDHLVARTVSSVYAAVALDAAKHELSGHDTMAEVQKVLQAAEDLPRIAGTNFGALMLENFQAPEVQQALGISDLAWLKSLAESRVGRLMLEQAAKQEDTRLVLLAFYAIAAGDSTREEYLKGHPQAGPAIALAKDFLRRVDRELVQLINSLVYPQIAVGLLIGVGLPLLLAGIFRLVLRLTLKPAKGMP